jgi:hypothetical protein
MYMLATLGTQHEDKQYKQHNTKCLSFNLFPVGSHVVEHFEVH